MKENISIKIQNWNFNWDNSKQSLLKNINIEIKKGEFVCVIGEV